MRWQRAPRSSARSPKQPGRQHGHGGRPDRSTPRHGGGIFSPIPRLGLLADELDLLSASAEVNWQRLGPCIFGNTIADTDQLITLVARGHFAGSGANQPACSQGLPTALLHITVLA